MKPFTFFTSAQLTTTNRQNTFQNPPVGALAQPITNSVRKQKPFQLGLPLNNPGRKFEPLFERDNQIDIQHQPFPLPQHTFYSTLPEQTGFVQDVILPQSRPTNVYEINQPGKGDQYLRKHFV